MRTAFYMSLLGFLAEWNNADSCVRVHTSGSTGKPKELLVEKSRMLASARITCDFLQLKPGDTALLCMPLDYIAGKMMVVRSIERNLNLIEVKPSNHPLSDIPLSSSAKGPIMGKIDFAAMVPSQVFGSLEVPEERERLKQISHLIIGGGAISAEMEQTLSTFPNAIWSTYGMTETLSHIALRRISGPDASLWYTPFQGVEISIANPESDNPNIGQLVIDAPHVCPETLVTNDIVEIDTSKRFRIIGRKDNVICSGGIKLHIEEIEEKLRPYIRAPFCISKRTDEKFGEVAVLLLNDNHNDNDNYYNTICREVLPAYSVPKAIFFVEEIPLTGTGKIDRAKARMMVETLS